MEKKFKLLFKGHIPSVRLFNQRLAELPVEEVNRYYSHAYLLGLARWREQSAAYQTFIRRLVQHDRQRFLDFTNAGILGELRYPLADPLMAARCLALFPPGSGNKRSFNHLSACFQLGFKCSLKNKTLAGHIRNQQFSPEELIFIYEQALIDSGEVYR